MVTRKRGRAGQVATRVRLLGLSLIFRLTLVAMASTLVEMASNLRAMASTLIPHPCT